MHSKTSNGMAGFKRQGMHRSALYALALLAILGWGASRASAAPLMALALLALVVIGWRRTRSAFLLAEQEPESE
jgi:hypothetical protein